MKQEEMPIGFSMALAMNPDAMQRFATLSEEQQKRIIEGTHAMTSKEDMHRYVNSLTNGTT
jgi:hypothetical protein